MIEKSKYNQRISQGDIYKNVWCYENISEEGSDIKINRIFFPYVVVLTQDCDVQQHEIYVGNKSGQLFSVLVAPLYNVASFMEGTHLENLNLKAPSFITSKSKGKLLQITGQYINTEGNLIISNQINRYHYLELDNGNVELPPSIVDFKHYFSVGVNYLKQKKSSDFICRLQPLYRELLTQRYSNYLSRIGLPNPEDMQSNT